MSTPEWSIFDRLEELEDITLKLMENADTTEPNLKNTSVVARDAIILARAGFTLAFVSAAAGVSNPRELKDRCIHLFRGVGLSKRMLDSMEEFMLSVCESAE